jgi:AcrR family transcriptional regulator
MTLWFDPIAARVQAMAERALGRKRARLLQAFRDVFQPDGERSVPADIVLAHLRDFCRARMSTFDPDPRVHAMLEGRREVWLEIANRLNMSEADIAALAPNVNDLLEETDDE